MSVVNQLKMTSQAEKMVNNIFWSSLAQIERLELDKNQSSNYNPATTPTTTLTTTTTTAIIDNNHNFLCYGVPFIVLIVVTLLKCFCVSIVNIVNIA